MVNLMSNDFKSQDHFRYSKLGKRWRRPVGWQSKLRKRKGGSGRKVNVGYGTSKEGELDEIITVYNERDVVLAASKPIRIASSVGAKGVIEIVKKAKELDSRIVNMKKVKRAKRIKKAIDAKKTVKKDKKEKEKTQESAETKDNKHDVKEKEEKK